MSDQNLDPKTVPDASEPPPSGERLRSLSTEVRRLYVVTIQEITQHEKHEQEWKVIGRKERDDRFGYVTTVKMAQQERLVFRAESKVCPSLSTVARLLEGDAPEAR